MSFYFEVTKQEPNSRQCDRRAGSFPSMPLQALPPWFVLVPLKAVWKKESESESEGRKALFGEENER